MITQIPMDGGSGRVPSGPIQFCDDWPGLFIRGDDAITLRQEIRRLEKSLRERWEMTLPHQLLRLVKVIEEEVIVGGVKD